MFSLVFSSAWISPKNIYDYVDNKHKFSCKNKSKRFLAAIQQADEAIEHKIQQQNSNVPISIEGGSSTNVSKISLKTLTLDELLETFDDNKAYLRGLFDERRRKLDRFNYGNGYDFLTVLSRIATSEQQQKMYCHMTDVFAEKNYIHSLKHENLFWTILLPEWLIAICAQKFAKSKEQIIAQIRNDEQDSFEANDSFDL